MSIHDLSDVDESTQENILFDGPHRALKIFAVVISIPNAINMFLKQSTVYGVMLSDTVAGIGDLIGSIILPLLVVLVFQVGDRFRNTDSRLKVFIYAQVLFFICQIYAIARMSGFIG